MLVLLGNRHRGPIYRVLSRFIGDSPGATNAARTTYFRCCGNEFVAMAAQNALRKRHWWHLESPR